MERSEGSDDDAVDAGAYPPAPLPPHERTWRHPSDLGTATWARTEPPLTIGRGLLITTGAVGGLLSLAVLWAMLPSVGRGGEAAPTVVTSVNNDLPSPTIATRFDTFVATSIDGRLTSTTLRSSPLNSPSDVTTTTTADRPPATISRQQKYTVDVTPVAVGVGESLVITTSRAVAGRKSITVMGADGQPYEAAVLMVDVDLGLAVLSADTAAVTSSYNIGPAVSAGDVVTVRGAESTTATVSIDTDGHLSLDAWSTAMPEGTPVLNADGQLVGMCSRGQSGPFLVSVANVAALLPPPKPTPAASPWMGVHVVDSATGVVTVDTVNANGPAAAAGIVVGDIITAVDGTTVTTVDQLKAAIAGHVPTDVVDLTITHADQTSTDASVTLGATPSM